MKNMKKMSAASVLLAALLVLCAGAALATDAPKETLRTETTDGPGAATQEEFDARTQSLAAEDERAVISQSAQAFSQITIEADAAGEEQSPVYVYTVTDEGGVQSIEIGDGLNIVWWTAEEYEDYVERQREGMAQLVAEGARAWTNDDGWFVWTQEKMDEVMAIYEQTLSEIRRGVHVSRTVNGSDDVVIHESPDGHQSLSLSLDDQRTSVYIQSDGGEAGK